MKKKFLLLTTFLIFTMNCFSQITFSDETKQYIAYNDSITVFTNALLIDGKGNPSKPHQTIIVSHGKIKWVGNDASAVIPKGATVINADGKAIMPGLVLMHEHMYISAVSLDPFYAHLRQLPLSFPRLYLAAGATTIRTCGSIEPYSDIRIKKDIDGGVLPGPFIELTAPYLEGDNGFFPQMKELKTPQEATAFVNYWASQGFTSFKAYMGIKKNVLKAAIDAAHQKHLKVTGHLCAVTCSEAAALGIDNLEHGFFASTDFVANKKENECPSEDDAETSFAAAGNEKAKKLIQFLINKKTGITSTLAVFEDNTTMQSPDTATLLSFLSADSKDFYLKIAGRLKQSNGPALFDRVFAANAKLEKMFYDMGGLLTVGTDPTGNGGVIAGLGSWRAIELLVKADGFTPLQAIRIATLNGATALGFSKTRGTIEPGKNADLLLIDGDPSINISDIRKVIFVFKNGVGYDSKRLFESMKGKVGFN